MPPLSVLPSLVSALWTQTLSATCANSTRTTWSSLLDHRPTFSMLWTSCMRWVFVGGSRLVSVPPNLRSWSSALSAAAQIVPCILGGVSLPLVPQYRYLGVTPLHVDVVCARGDRFFHQACAWCRGEGLPLSFSSSIFITYVLSSSSFVLEFVGDDSAALQQLNLSLRRWCRHLLDGPVLSPVAAAHWELGIGDALRFALGRAFSLFGRLCAMDHSSSPPPIPAGVSRICSSVQGTWSHWCASALCSLSIPHPGHVGISWAPLLRPSDVGSLEKPFPAWTVTSAAGFQPRLPTCMACLSMSLLTTSFLPGRTRSTHSTSPPSAVRLWGHARCGHDLSSTRRPSRHRLGPPTCPFCNDADGSLAHHLSSCPARVNARAVWAHSCGVSPPDVPTLALHGWVFNPLDESNTPKTIRAHIHFVGLVCERLQPLSW